VGLRGEGDAGTSYMLRKRSSRLRYIDQGACSYSDRLHERGTHSIGITSIYLTPLKMSLLCFLSMLNLLGTW
jgi:hypothetical protein